MAGKKQLWESEAEPKVIVIDVTESKIEPPKKNRSDAIAEKKEITGLLSQVAANQETGEHDLYFFWARRKP